MRWKLSQYILGSGYLFSRILELNKSRIIVQVQTTFQDLEESNILRPYMSNSITEISKAWQAFEAKESALQLLVSKLLAWITFCLLILYWLFYLMSNSDCILYLHGLKLKHGSKVPAVKLEAKLCFLYFTRLLSFYAYFLTRFYSCFYAVYSCF